MEDPARPWDSVCSPPGPRGGRGLPGTRPVSSRKDTDRPACHQLPRGRSSGGLSGPCRGGLLADGLQAVNGLCLTVCGSLAAATALTNSREKAPCAASLSPGCCWGELLPRTRDRTPCGAVAAPPGRGQTGRAPCAQPTAEQVPLVTCDQPSGQPEATRGRSVHLGTTGLPGWGGRTCQVTDRGTQVALDTPGLAGLPPVGTTSCVPFANPSVAPTAGLPPQNLLLTAHAGHAAAGGDSGFRDLSHPHSVLTAAGPPPPGDPLASGHGCGRFLGQP